MSTEGGIAISFKWDGFDPFVRYQLKRAPFRRAIRRAGAVVSREAKRRVSATNNDKYPSRKTGRLRKSIRVRVSRPGLLVRVEPTQRADMAKFYPAYLHFGTPRITPRGHYMADALESSRAEVVRILRAGLGESL